MTSQTSPPAKLSASELNGGHDMYAQVLTPLARATSIIHEPSLLEDGDSSKPLRVNKLVYTSAVLALLQATHQGWSLLQMNFDTFNNRQDCDARPVAPGTCVMFPGHTKTDWLFVVNAWVVGGMLGGLSSGYFSDRFGRKQTLMGNAVVMIIGSILQAAAPSLAVFSLGRGVSGLASGAAVAMCNAYVNEVTPPSLRAMFGSGYGIAVATGCVFVSVFFFFAGTASGWRLIGGCPMVVATGILILAPKYMVETPSWLLLQGRQDDAERVLSQLYGKENVKRALDWIKTKSPQTNQEHGSATSPWKLVFSKAYRRQLGVAVHIVLSLQITGINAVFFYSSSLFKTAGVSDSRLGTLVVSLCYFFPTPFVAFFTRRYGNRNMLLAGMAVMLVSAIGLTLALSFQVSALSLVFVGLYTISFSGSFGALAYSAGVSLFPDVVRATGTAIMMLVNWIGVLLIGISYPYISSALDDLAFLPFVGTLVYSIWFTYTFVPNTTGKTNAEIQELFTRK
ncbi:hypothetical protein Poli38472_001171 [Pythium oligandrum]|uniref:Hexose transporter 1 n=1 Tax=Pythium oligandrum TaxID=41045 RepID=A0A8K1FM64_PYTOL|nr:hypothetical protein Poli38472_001171 [Pythium oligandrum]|eukprot:TMW69015.1 hypothetical protein Poli38472_001171 [Pythium oligandrum]